MIKAKTVEEYKRKQALARELEERAMAKVRTWTEEAFEPGSVELLLPSPMPGLPGAATIRDAAGATMTVWYDIFTDQVRWSFGKDGAE